MYNRHLKLKYYLIMTIESQNRGKCFVEIASIAVTITLDVTLHLIFLCNVLNVFYDLSSVIPPGNCLQTLI